MKEMGRWGIVALGFISLGDHIDKSAFKHEEKYDLRTKDRRARSARRWHEPRPCPQPNTDAVPACSRALPGWVYFMPMTPAPSVSLPSDALLERLVPLCTVDSCGGLRAHVAPDVFLLWEEWERECGCETPIPYWAVVWPGAVVLARFILSHPELVDGKKVLDFGCGGGCVGIAAIKAGARCVIAADIDNIALEIARRNARANELSLEFDNSDYLVPSTETDAEVILAADMFYERGTATRTWKFLTRCARRGSSVLIADGERTFAPTSGVTLLHRECVSVNKELEGVAERTVRILRVEEGR